MTDGQVVTEARCIGYSSKGERRCRTELVAIEGAERWRDRLTGRPGSELSDRPRCEHHPRDTDPPGWSVDQDAGEAELIHHEMGDSDPDAGNVEPIGPDRQIAAEAPPPGTEAEAASEPEPANELGEEWADLPPVEEPEPEGVESQPADLGKLDRAARELIGEEADPAGTEAPDGAPDAPDPGTPGAGLSPGPDIWSPDEVASVFRMANPYLERAGADPVPDSELREGGKVLVSVFNRWARRMDPDLWLPLMWIGKTYGPRAYQIGQAMAGEDGPEPASEPPEAPEPAGNGGPPEPPLAWQPDTAT